MKKLFINSSMSLVLLSSLFSGCGSSSDSSNTSKTVNVQRGAVLDALVTDASNQKATWINGTSQYTFDKEIVYPITVKNGFIDIDDSGDKSVGDVKLTTELKTYTGENITLITTAISNEDEKVRKELLDALAKKLDVSKEELLKLPNESYESAIVSNEIYRILKNDTSLKINEIIADIDNNGLKTNFDIEKNKIDKEILPKEYALNLEREYIKDLKKQEKIETISYEDIKNEAIKNSYELSIFHVNDVHSHITSESMDLEFDGIETEVEVGGYARYVTKIDELKVAKPNSLVLNAGDVFQGTLYYSLFKGEADASAMNLISWDAYALGNHEFDDGDEGLKTFLDMLKDTSVISANVTPKAGSLLDGYWKPYIIKEVNGQKIGVIGIDIVGKTKNSSNPSEDIVFTDEIKTAQKYIDELESKGINKIVLLTHQGYNYDIKMAKELTGVDIIVGGDSHSLIGDFSNFGLSSHADDFPTRKKSKDNKKVCIVQAWEYGHILGDLDVLFDESGEVIACDGTPRLLVGDKFIQNDEEVNENTKNSILDIIKENENIEIVVENEKALNTIDSFVKQVDTKKSDVLGTASERLGHNRIPGDKKDGVEALALGSDIAPIVAKSFYDLSNRADACIQNAGGVRIAIEEGEVTFGDAYTLLPFANTLYEIDMMGSEIKAVLEDAVEEAMYGGEDKTISTGAFPYAYGLKYDVDATKEKGNRISNLEIKNRKTSQWGNIIEDKMYVIVTNNYISKGKDGYLTFKEVQDKRGEGVDTYLDYAMSFVRYVQKLKSDNKSLEKLPNTEHPIKSFINKK